MISMPSSLSHIVALMLIVLAVNTEAIQFLTKFSPCTNANDGVESHTLFLAAPACQPINGGTSIGGSCSSGVYKQFNSTDCTGTVLATFNDGECVAPPGAAAKTRFICEDVNDSEYLRMRFFPITPGTTNFDCNNASPMTIFVRLNKCYESSTGNGHSFKFTKVNLTAFVQTDYTALGCDSGDISRTTTELADEECNDFGVRVDFIAASNIGNNAGLVHISGYILTFVLAFVGIVLMI